MNLKYLSLFLFCYFPSNWSAQAFGGAKPCKVIERPTGDAKECQFPFIYNEKAYYGCITVDAPDGKAWCSTRGSALHRSNWEFSSLYLKGLLIYQMSKLLKTEVQSESRKFWGTFSVK